VAEPFQGTAIAGFAGHAIQTEPETFLDVARRLSKMTGVPQSTLAYWEKTGKLTGRETIFKLAKALGVSVAELLREGQ
jgi:transcriptional regulator with XRE-family HTH domain